MAPWHGKPGAHEAEQLVRAHYADVLRYCRRHAPAGLAEDAAQETFLRFVRAGSGYRERGRARAYLITIARNVCIDYARSPAGAWDELPASLADPADDHGALDAAHDLAAALAGLPRLQREAVELRFGQDLKVGEVARVLGISRFAVSRALTAALRCLREQLAPGGAGEDGLRDEGSSR